MTEQQKQDFFIFLQKFCSDNISNRLNEWIIEAFLNRACQKLEAIYKADNAVVPHDAKTDPRELKPGKMRGMTNEENQSVNRL